LWFHAKLEQVGLATDVKVKICDKVIYSDTTYIYIYTGCPRRNVPYFGRVFLMLKYNPKQLYPKLNGYGDNGERSLKL
jgi:hypothetical protein